MIKTISSRTEAEYTDRNSRFLGYLFPCSSIKEFEPELTRVKGMFPDASHHCYAYRINPGALQEMAHDDGEPGGTAGLPILNRMKSYEIINAGLVVIRYFGGVKLGKPGLIKAYGSCADLCLQKADILKLIEAQEIKVIFPYTESNRIDKIIHKYHCRIVESEYLEDITLSMQCPEHQSGNLLNELEHYSHLDISFSVGSKGYMSIDA